jgi:hypothetical protein
MRNRGVGSRGMRWDARAEGMGVMRGDEGVSCTTYAWLAITYLLIDVFPR